MSEGDRIIDFLATLPTGGCCDECLSKRTGLRPAAAVGKACRALAGARRLVRKRGRCALGDHTKVLNMAAARPARRARTRSPARPALPEGVTIEQAWRYVDRLCRGLWSRHLSGEAPSSLAELVTALRDDEILPQHEANMMHTIRSLRNFVVHENVDFGAHETTIAQSALQIVGAWAQREETELWRIVLRSG